MRTRKVFKLLIAFFTFWLVVVLCATIMQPTANSIIAAMILIVLDLFTLYSLVDFNKEFPE